MAEKYRQTPKAEFAKLFRTILEHLVDPPSLPLDINKRHLIVLGTNHRVEMKASAAAFKVNVGTFEDGTPRPTIQVDEEGAVAFCKLVRQLGATTGIGDMVAEDHLENEVLGQMQRLVAEPPEGPEAWDTRIQDFIKSLRRMHVPNKVYLPLVNLKLEEDLHFGNVSFLRNATAREQIKELYERWLEDENLPNEYKAKMTPHIKRVMPMFASTLSCAVVTVDCHESMASQKAHDTVRKFVNLLRCYVSVVYGNSEMHRIGIHDDIGQIELPVLITSKETHFKLPLKLHGFVLPYEVNSNVLAFLQRYGDFDYLCGVLAKKRDERTKLERELATAIWWIGSGNHRASEAESMVDLAIGLEALLIPRKSEEIVEDIAYRGSFLLSAENEERERTYKRIKELYNHRSDIVHEGNVEVPDDYLADMKYYALAILVEMAKRAQRGWASIDDLLEAIRPVKFGGKPNLDTPSPIPRGPAYLSVKGRLSSGSESLAFKMQY